MFITRTSINSTCIFEFYQPKMPKGSDKLKNFK
ncbi:cyclic lactone autoinducer peptide [Tyzzerella sp. An114]